MTGAIIYLDASFLFSLHFRDSNTASALLLASRAAETLVVSALCEMETINAFGLRVFRGEMSEQNVVNAMRDLESDFRSGLLQWRPVSDEAFQRAKALSRKHTASIGVRAADLLHVATAIELGATTFFTFDLKQALAAQTAGLVVNEPPGELR